MSKVETETITAFKVNCRKADHRLKDYYPTGDSDDQTPKMMKMVKILVMMIRLMRND